MREDFRRVTLPRLTRPNLVARLYMIFTAMSTAAVAWAVPGSTIKRIMESGGATAHVVVGVLLAFALVGFADIVTNDLFAIQERSGARSIAGRLAFWFEDQRMQRCFVIGGCYMVLTLAGVGSPIAGTFWLLFYYMQMSFCAGLQAWSLLHLMSATVVGGRDAAA